MKRTQDLSLLPIKRTAIDCSGRLGSLYDACEDQPLRTLDVNFQQPFIEFHAKAQCILESGDKNAQRNLLELIHIDEQLRLSLLLGLTSKTGIATLVDYPHTINEYTRVLHYYYIHREERFPDEVQKIRDRPETGLSKTNATHIVTGVSWGVDIVVILQLPPEYDVAKRIDSVLEKYRAYLNGDSNDFKLTREDLDSNRHIIDTKIYSNIPAVTEMTALHNVFHTISRLKADDTQYRQLSYILYPISNSNYIPLDRVHNAHFEQYVSELITSMKTIETCFNEDMPRLLRGHLTERFSHAYRQWLTLKDEYANLMERFSKLIVELRCGLNQTSALDRLLGQQAQIILKNNITNLYQNVTELNRKAHLITDLSHESIQYCNVMELKIDKNDNEDTLKRKLVIDENIDRVLCSNDLLNKKNPAQLKKLRHYLIEELENNFKLKLIYADFSGCTYELRDMMLLPSIQNDTRKKYSKFRDLSISADNNTSISSLRKTHKHAPLSASKLSMNETINVLLLGETGVGKSTFINALVNYLTFKTIDKAKSEKPIVAIPTTFTTTTRDNFQEHTVKCGDFTKSTNENFRYPGQSITQRCRSHIYNFHNNDGTKLRIIDTPGFGDTRGLPQDNRHMQRILDYIKKFKYFNAICIFLKPNESKLNTYFRSCLTQLFNAVGPDARQNIVFCYTNARATFYAPGSTGPLLKQVISSLSVGDIPSKRKNTFCFDNESFLYLAALQNNVPFNDQEKREYEASWSNSVTEANRFIRYIRRKLPVYYIPDESELIRSAEIEIVQMIHSMLETMRSLLRKIIRCKMNLFKVSFESDLNDVDSSETKNNHHHHRLQYSPPPQQTIPIDFFEDYRIANSPSSKMQDDTIDQLTLLCHVSVEFSYFLLRIAHYSQSDPFLNGFIRMINEENIICESRNRNYVNLQLVEGLKTLANNYKQRIEATKSSPKQNILLIISQWIKYMLDYPLISEYTIDNIRESLNIDNRITSISNPCRL
ncbi:unnamed protein product [Rotaria socialis]|uniref:G domain-containing protein n=1 Tax=Rotaria socialis TaxID=392032 RepID=A0A818NZM7_9BILA|nr:unnamed protein product [Rotaria socialis]CAF4298405.1 unnamed protein product [Rotaria socialis]